MVKASFIVPTSYVAHLLRKVGKDAKVRGLGLAAGLWLLGRDFLVPTDMQSANSAM